MKSLKLGWGCECVRGGAQIGVYRVTTPIKPNLVPGGWPTWFSVLAAAQEKQVSLMQGLVGITSVRVKAKRRQAILRPRDPQTVEPMSIT